MDGSLSSTERIQRTISVDTSLIFIVGGTNDWGENSDEVTFKHALEEDIKFIDIFNSRVIEQWNRNRFLRNEVHLSYWGELEIERMVADWIRNYY